MAISKALRTRLSGATGKQNQLEKVDSARVISAAFMGISNVIPSNPKLKPFSTKTESDETSKVIILKVNPSLNKLTTDPLNPKALQAKSMFANYRKNN